MPVIQGHFRNGRPALNRESTRRSHTGAHASTRDVFPVAPAWRLPGGAGQPLPPGVLQKMERVFAARLSDVRVRVGREAAAIGARAFTVGSDIHFAPGQYRPEAPDGQRLLGHELTHVLQQRAGRVPHSGPGIVVVHDPALEAEAERMSARVASAIQSPRGTIMACRNGVAQARLAPQAQAIARPHGSGAFRRTPFVSRVVQRAEDEPSTSDLWTMAAFINQSHSGRADSRNTQALVRTNSGTRLFTQREYSAFDGAIEQLEDDYGMTIDERVIGDNRQEDEGIHAEMLAVSWWVQGKTSKPTDVGVSQNICARCKAVLNYFSIDYEPTSNVAHDTQNWVHPYRHAGKAKGSVPVPLRQLPQKVTKGKAYAW